VKSEKGKRKEKREKRKEKRERGGQQFSGLAGSQADLKTKRKWRSNITKK